MSNELIKLRATADILGGDVFYATETGTDPENPDNGGLLADGMYIRLNGSDGSIAYISAFELDKALGIIGEMSMSKASAAELTALQATVADMPSKTDMELLEGEVEGKAAKTDVEALIDLFDGKADQTAVDEIIAALNEKASQEYAETIMAEIESKANQSDVDNLVVTVASKAEAAEVAEMLSDIQALQATVSALANPDSINAINNQIAYLNAEIVKRLTIDDLTTIKADIANLKNNEAVMDSRVGLLEVNMNKKATTTYVQGQVNELNTAITGVAAVLGNKADRTDLSIKANKTDLDNVVRKVNTLNASVAEIDATVDDNYRDLTTAIAKKATKSDVDTAIETINATITSKADKTTLNDAVSQLNSKYDTLEETHSNLISNVSGDIDELECTMNNSIAELRSTLTTQGKTLTKQGTDLTKLQDASKEYAEQLKQTWVRVLTSREYRNLRTAPENAAYNPRYKYPNTVYLVVDFNKPKAIYIGDILIAQAEQKGSVGFAYTFPIIF